MNCDFGRNLTSKVFVLPLMLQIGYQPRRTSRIFACNSQESCHPSNTFKKYDRHPQNVDLPPILPRNKKKPFPIPIKKLIQSARQDKKLAEMRIEKPLDPPKNGLLVPDLVPVAYEVLEHWKVLIKGLSQLLNVVTVYGCR